MRISRIHINNFRNFKELDVEPSSQTVIVGENKIGKSNLLYALRLVLDPSLPDSARYLRLDDFWDGLERPLKKDDRILISVEFQDFDEDENLLADLAEYLIEPAPMTSRLTYVFQPIGTLEDGPKSEADYEFYIFGGTDHERKVGYELRRRIPFDLLPALRDAESDLRGWRKSPLKQLLSEASSQIGRDKLQEIATGVQKATDALRTVQHISDLSTRITSRLTSMVGKFHSIDMSLGFSPTDPESLIRSLRLFIDEGKRGVDDASLGSANLLYLCLKTLELELYKAQGSRDHTFIGIEEPEAHLHPHLQRLVYRNYLYPKRTEGDEEGEDSSSTIFLTTHSPHIASVAPLRSVLVLRKSSDGHSSEGVATFNLDLDEKDIQDLERYIDVNRGEILFSKGILLVEGDAEKYIVPVLARLLGYDLDELGISVCSVSGTNFLPYTKLLGENGLQVPFSIITDFDPQGDGTNLSDKRVLKLLELILGQDGYARHENDKLLRMAPRHGLYVGAYTFEVDLFKCGRHKSMCKAIIELTENGAAKTRSKGWEEDPDSVDVEQLLKDINEISKGRYAQRLSTKLTGNKCPEYIKKAIKYVADKCK